MKLKRTPQPARRQRAAPKLGRQRWLAQQLGISQQRVSVLVHSEDWPFGPGPWLSSRVGVIRQHVLERRAANNASAAAIEDDPDASEEAIKALSSNPERQARIRYIIEKTSRARLERELLLGVYLKREDVEKRGLSQVYAVRAKMQEIPLRAALLVGRTEAECERVLSDWMQEVCTFFADGG